MLTKKEVEKLRDTLLMSKRPFYMFDDDPDGLCSFLLFYRKLREGKGMIMKTRPLVTTKFIPKITEYGADKVFVLDIAQIEQDFVDNVGVPVVWVDHHDPQKIEKCMYFNPQIRKTFVPTTYMAYQVVKQDLWLAAAGCVADWYLPSFLKEFEKEFPDYINRKYKSPPDILFDTPLGTLIHAFSFNLKGTAREAMKSAKILTRVEHPDEILKQKTARGKFIWKRYQRLNQRYQTLKSHALKKGMIREGVFVFTYASDEMAMSSDLSNELIAFLPQKVVILAREKSGELKCSIRSSADGPNVKRALERALLGINGYGGGHEHACGANIPKIEFRVFFNQFVEELKKDPLFIHP